MSLESASPEHWRQIEALFARAADLPVGDRAGFLDARTDDPELRKAVDRLLAAHERAEGFLGQLDTARAGALLHEADPGIRTGEVIGRYRVIRRLGRGGMGVVWLAHDPRLDRPVALKLLPPYMSADDAAHRRLAQEAKVACALDDPHIATIHEIGETPDGRLFIAMAYYEGETLRQRIERGPLPIEEALGLATQIAEGLAAAHAHGIIHRDIKPANVIVTPNGVAKIVDFGIAKVAGHIITQTGATKGTVAYMSPEQTRSGAVDPRTDLWSLGVVLYEMLACERPFRADDEQALIYAIRHDEPTPLREIRSEVSPELAHVVARCLSKDPATRYASATDLRAALRAAGAARTAGPIRRMLTLSRKRVIRPVLLLAAAAAAAAAALLFHQDAGQVPGQPRAAAAAIGATHVPGAPSRLAVLPLANLSSSPDDEYLADGMTDELIARLSRLQGLQVIARTSVLPYKGTRKNIAEIANELGVGAVLEGSVRKAGNRVRITVRLVDARSEEPLWSDVYDAEVGDVLATQGEIAGRVARALNVELRRDDRRRLARADTEESAAYDLYLRGRYFWNKRDAGNFQKALSYFRDAIDRDPLYAPAWAGLADTYEMLAESPLLQEQRMALARAAAERALVLDPDLAEAHTALATVLLSTGTWDGARSHFRMAIDLNPSYALAYQRYSALLAGTGRLNEAVQAARRAQELDPLSMYARASLGNTLYLARRYDEALAQLRATRELDPEFGLTHLNLVLLHLQTREYDQALSAARTLHSLWGDHPTVLGLLGHTYAVAGREEEARKVLRQLNTQAEDHPVSSFHIAVLHLGLGERAGSIELLDRAVEEKRTGLIIYLGVDPIFDPLRPDSRFQAVLRKAGLALNLEEAIDANRP